jgi:hypothetical protein
MPITEFTPFSNERKQVFAILPIVAISQTLGEREKPSVTNLQSHLALQKLCLFKKKEKADKDKLFVCWSINIQAIPHDKWVKIRLVWQQFGKAKVMLT